MLRMACVPFDPVSDGWRLRHPVPLVPLGVEHAFLRLAQNNMVIIFQILEAAHDIYPELLVLSRRGLIA